jgi:YegS/Rv2252/BmrU family lipid kinase
MPAKIIFNPYSNRWGARRQEAVVRRLLTELGYEFEMSVTEGPGHAIQLAAEAVARGFDPIVAAGGDGTIGEVVNGLLGAGRRAPVRLGVIPLGSANDYAVQLGIPADLAAACRILSAAAHVYTLDAGRVNERAFMNDVTLGFGARVNIEAATIKRLRGSLIYLGGVFKALARYPLPTVSYAWDDGRLENHPTLMAYIGIGWRTGGVFHLTPDAVQDDGLLDFFVGDAMGRLSILRLLPKTFDGSHIHDPRVHFARCTWVRISSDDPLPVLADGEIIYRDAHRLDVHILPAALQVIGGPEPGQRPGGRGQKPLTRVQVG